MDHWAHKPYNPSYIKPPGFITAWRKSNSLILGSNVPHSIVRHSPDGFNCGYGGSGPAEFALNILKYVTSEEPSASLYQKFKGEFIATVICGDNEMIILSEALVRKWVENEKSNQD